MATYIWTGLEYTNVQTGALYETFQKGVSEPRSSASGYQNIGNNPLRPLKSYGGTWTDGVAKLTDGGLYENIVFDGVVDIQSPVTLRNCRIQVPPEYTFSDSIKACVRVLNGSNTKNVLLENVEIHNLAQRPFNGITGRNFIFRRGVVTGCIDGFSDSTSGSAPNDGTGFTVEDSVVPVLAWWYSPEQNNEIHPRDTQSHSDGIQKTTDLRCVFRNVALFAFADPSIGTGTPGSGRDGGNPWAPPSGYDFTVRQADMEAWRRDHLAGRSVAAESHDGVTQSMPTKGEGSFAAVMLNSDNVLFEHCWFGGGNVTVNAADTGLPDTIRGGFQDCMFWNDMLNGPTARSSDSTVKGNAVLLRSGKQFETFTRNRWFDGTSVEVTTL